MSHPADVAGSNPGTGDSQQQNSKGNQLLPSLSDGRNLERLSIGKMPLGLLGAERRLAPHHHLRHLPLISLA